VGLKAHGGNRNDFLWYTGTLKSFPVFLPIGWLAPVFTQPAPLQYHSADRARVGVEGRGLIGRIMNAIETAHHYVEVICSGRYEDWKVVEAQKGLTDVLKVEAITRELDRWISIRVDSQPNLKGVRSSSPSANTSERVDGAKQERSDKW
jgi:hypothetical protein